MKIIQMYFFHLQGASASISHIKNVPRKCKTLQTVDKKRKRFFASLPLFPANSFCYLKGIIVPLSQCDRGLRSKKTWIWTMSYSNVFSRMQIRRVVLDKKIDEKNWKGWVMVCSSSLDFFVCVINGLFHKMCITK